MEKTARFYRFTVTVARRNLLTPNIAQLFPAKSRYASRISAGSSLPLLRKRGSKCIACGCWAERNAKITQLGHVHPNETARVDTGEGLKIHIHIQGNTMIGAAITYFQSE